MGASSVTGVGLGSADGSNKGRKHWSVGVERLIGPRPMAVGSVTLDGDGVGEVVLPRLAGVTADYVVVATGATEAAVGATVTINDNDTTLAFSGANDGVVAYAVLKKGLAI